MASPLSEKWLAAVIDTSDDAVMLIDPDRIILLANTAAEAFARRNGTESIVGKSYDELLRRNLVLDEHGEVNPVELCPSDIALTEGKSVRGKLFQYNIDDTPVWLRVTSVPIFDDGRKVACAIVRLKDVSDRRALEDKLSFLLQSSRLVPLTVDFHERLTYKASLTVPLIADWCTINVTNDDGSLSREAIVHRDPGKMALVNEFEEALSKRQDSKGARHVASTGVAEFYPDALGAFPADAPSSPEGVAVARALGLGSLMILPIISHGTVLGILSLGYDESKRKYSPEDLTFMQEYCNHISSVLENGRLYEEIKKHDASKDSFLATLSHELRNPLAPIKSMLELMKLQPHAAEFSHNISIIEHQFDHITKILNDLLEVTRYSRGKINVELRRVNLISVMRNIVESVEPFLKEKKVALHVSLPLNAIVIRADQTRLEQALMNVLHNAEKFTPAEGHIWVTVTTDEKTATITIRDSGIGMEPHMVAHIFEPGIRDEKKHRTEGLGLGLLLVKEVVHLHGGTVKAHSDGLGKGSEFTITLPVLQQRLL